MKIPLILFPGLACTQRLFAPQKEGLDDIANVIVPDWVEPSRADSLQMFASRWGAAVWERYFASGLLSADDGCFVGGLSFGGMVSPLVGKLLHDKGVHVHGAIRLATFRCGDEIPERFRWIWSSLNLFPGGGWYVSKIYCALVLRSLGGRLSFARREVYQQVLESPARRSIEVVRMLAQWRGAEPIFDFPILQIHGARDMLLPIRYTSPQITIPRAGHCLTLTQPSEVNEAIREFLLTRNAQHKTTQQTDLQ
ncbi:MAG: alpha/beta hydrolase [Planctomycetia bacterium]|nr:alpha/beta hydrolase [Planctomycetia bacterium]